MNAEWLVQEVGVNPSWTPFVHFKGELFENGRRYAKSDNTIQKGLKKRIQNYILHVQFMLKISVSQSNFVYPKHGVYVYNALKWQKMPKRVKMLNKTTIRPPRHILRIFFLTKSPCGSGLDQNCTCTTTVDHGGQQNLTINTFILMHSVCQETIFFCRKQRGRGDFTLCPLPGPQGNLTRSNWHIARLYHVYYKIRLQLGLWDTY